MKPGGARSRTEAPISNLSTRPTIGRRNRIAGGRMRVLITGITGFAGSHLAEFLIANHPDVKVFGIVRWRSRVENILPIRDNIELCEADLKAMASLKG